MSIISRGYWRLVRRRTWEETSKWVGGTRPAIFTLLAAILAPFVVGFAKGWRSAEMEWLIAAIPVGLIIVFMAVNFVRSFRLLHEEQLKAVDSIEKKYDELVEQTKDRKTKKKTVLMLVSTMGRFIVGIPVSDISWPKWLDAQSKFPELLRFGVVYLLHRDSVIGRFPAWGLLGFDLWRALSGTGRRLAAWCESTRGGARASPRGNLVDSHGGKFLVDGWAL